jgi:hypothetical protein
MLVELSQTNCFQSLPTLLPSRFTLYGGGMLSVIFPNSGFFIQNSQLWQYSRMNILLGKPILEIGFRFRGVVFGDFGALLGDLKCCWPKVDDNNDG